MKHLPVIPALGGKSRRIWSSESNLAILQVQGQPELYDTLSKIKTEKKKDNFP